MCITSTARRRSLTLQVLPSHLLTTSTEAGSQSHPKSVSAIAAAVAASSGRSISRTQLQAAASSPETQLTFSHPSVAKAAAAAAHHAHKKAVAAAAFKKTNTSHSNGATSHLPHHDGLIVQHHYHDHAADPTVDPTQIKHKAKGGVITPFPVKLHDMLDKIEADGLGNVVSWQPHGRCFVVHKPKEFVNHVMPHYFKQTKMASFQRQLNLYGFNRLTGGLDKGGYYHEMFLRGKVCLSYDIHRMRVKGTGVRLPTNPDNEPNFYALPPVIKDAVPPPASAMMSMMMSGRAPEKQPRNAASAPMPPLPALPSPNAATVNMSQRRADLLKESHTHSMKIAKQQQRQVTRPIQRRSVAHQQMGPEGDVVFFEGLPFHYLDPSALPSRPGQKKSGSAAAKLAAARQVQQQPGRPKFKAPLSPLKAQPKQKAVPADLLEVKRPKFAKSSSTVVSESDSSGSDDESHTSSKNDNKQHHNASFLPSFSPSNMDWDGPLSCPTLQAHMRRSSFQSFAKDTTLVEAMSARPIEEDIESFFQGFDMPVDLYHDQIERMQDDDDTAFGYLLEQAITE